LKDALHNTDPEMVTHLPVQCTILLKEGVSMGAALVVGCVGLVLVISVIAFVKHQKRKTLHRGEGAQTNRRPQGNPSTLAALRQNLRLKVGWDESKIDRLIQLERERLPKASLQTLMEAAIERWERDNR
jgi:apolipoprotein N-acyltransferase